MGRQDGADEKSRACTRPDACAKIVPQKGSGREEIARGKGTGPTKATRRKSAQAGRRLGRTQSTSLKNGLDRLLIVAVAARLPEWAEAGCRDYLGRLPREYRTRRIQVRPEPRTQGLPAAKILDHEATRIACALPPGARTIALDERGRDLTSAQFAQQLRRWLDEGGTTAFVIGGPDGLQADLKTHAAMRLRLSSFTLPHAMAQLLLCEQLYRAASLLSGHPYHRAGAG